MIRRPKTRFGKSKVRIFRRFWSERVLAPGKETISDDDCDAIIRILDFNGKGKPKGSEVVAKVMVSQNVWRKLFNILHSDKKLASLVDSIFKETNIDRKAQLIDELYVENAAGKNWLTGESGNVLNALLAAYDPVKNLSAVSIKHRKALVDFLEIKSPFDWASASIGKRISHSNESIQEATRALGLTGSARTLYRFLYSEPVCESLARHHQARRQTSDCHCSSKNRRRRNSTGEQRRDAGIAANSSHPRRHWIKNGISNLAASFRPWQSADKMDAEDGYTA